MLRSAVTGAVLVVLVACGSGGSKTRAGDKTESSSLSTTSTSGVSPTSTAAGSTTPVSVAATHPTTHLVAVRAARQEGSDRVVFEFADQVPGYRVAYSGKPIVGTSGKEVAVAGTVALVVRMEAASGVDLNGGFRQIYQGPNRVHPSGTQQVQEVAQVEDFEGVLMWAVGLKTEMSFRVTALSSPSRLVIDVVG